MAYDLALAERIRNALSKRRGITEQHMFGGIAFLLRGNLLVAIWKNSLIARLGPERAAAALQEPFIKKFDVTGKPMTGWVMVSPEGMVADGDLSVWLELALDFVRELPAKPKTPR